MIRLPRWVLAAATLLPGAIPVRAEAQALEARADAIVTGPAAIHGGIGLMVPAGTYLRSGIVGGLGASADGVSGRVDAVTRFHLDPFREHRWALYAGGGLTARFDEHRRTRVGLLVLVGVDGPARKGLTTAVEAALGRGARIGLIIRHGTAERR
jgi:hypothetical protein